MSDRYQNQAQRIARERDQARQAEREARRALEDCRYLLGRGVIPNEYISALVALDYTAHNGVNQPADLGGNITTTHSKSKPPAYDTAAYRELRAETEHLRRRARKLNGDPGDARHSGLLERLCHGPTTNSTPL